MARVEEPRRDSDEEQWLVEISLYPDYLETIHHYYEDGADAWKSYKFLREQFERVG